MFNGLAFFVKGEGFHDGSLTDTISFSLFIGCRSLCYSALQQKAQQAWSGLLLLCEVLGRIQTCSYVCPLLNVDEIYAFTAQNFKRVKAVEKYQPAQVSRNCWILSLHCQVGTPRISGLTISEDTCKFLHSAVVDYLLSKDTLWTIKISVFFSSHTSREKWLKYYFNSLIQIFINHQNIKILLQDIFHFYFYFLKTSNLPII